MRCTNFAFAGFRHDHIFMLYNALSAREDIRIVGAFEADAQARANAEKKGGLGERKKRTPERKTVGNGGVTREDG